MADENLRLPHNIVHTTAALDKKTGNQLCVRCGALLHYVNLSSLPAPGVIENELSKPEAHCYAPGINVIQSSRPMILGEYKEGQAPQLGAFCQAAKKGN